MRPHSYYHDLGIYRPDVIVPFGFLSMPLQGSIFAAVYLRLAARIEPAAWPVERHATPRCTPPNAHVIVSWRRAHGTVERFMKHAGGAPDTSFRVGKSTAANDIRTRARL